MCGCAKQPLPPPSWHAWHRPPGLHVQLGLCFFPWCSWPQFPCWSAQGIRGSFLGAEPLCVFLVARWQPLWSSFAHMDLVLKAPLWSATASKKPSLTNWPFSELSSCSDDVYTALSSVSVRGRQRPGLGHNVSICPPPQRRAEQCQ
jgi:hypothetical protein